ncbi:MAG: cytochrome c oxidase subunit II [Halobacteriota archaeon]
MTRTRLRRSATLGFAGLLATAVFTTPVAAQSTTRDLVMGLNRDLLLLAVPIAIFMEGLLLYTVLKYRNNDEAKPTPENKGLEISWTVATALILVFVGFASYQVLAHPDVTPSPEAEAQLPDDAVVVDVTARQFLWEFDYQDENVSTLNEMVVPTDRPIYLRVHSADVIHAVHVPELALKVDAIPGQTNRLQTTITEEGTYQLYCAEYCGQGHSKMLATVEVVSSAEYEDWLDEQQSDDEEDD